MQQSWRTDGDKLTFIVCTNKTDATSYCGTTDDINEDDHVTDEAQRSTKLHSSMTEIDRMIGDVNLFLNPAEPDGETQEDSSSAESPGICGEIELMIAEVSARGKGLGLEILDCFFQYIMENLDSIIQEYTVSNGQDHSDVIERRVRLPGLRYFRVKINESNSRSLRLFERAGFSRISPTANFFGEVELRLLVEDLRSEWKQRATQTPSYLEYVDEQGQTYP